MSTIFNSYGESSSENMNLFIEFSMVMIIIFKVRISIRSPGAYT